VIFGLSGSSISRHGAFCMLGAFAAYVGLQFPRRELLVRARARALAWTLGIATRRLFLRHFVSARSSVRLLWTFGIALIREGIMAALRRLGKSYPVPDYCGAGSTSGFMGAAIYRAWVVLASLTVCG